MIEDLKLLFSQSFGAVPALVVRAPGRVNLIGEHTDYNDGFVLPCAIGKQTMVAVRARQDGLINIVAGDFDVARNSFRLDQPILPDPGAPWSNYVRGMASLLKADGLDLRGADVAILGDMPQGAGLSSSAALEIATGLAFAALAGQPDFDRTRLAQLGQRTEHEFAGCNCGIMDQLVSARAEAGMAMLIDCRSLATSAVPIPDDLAILIVHSGIERGLVDGAYNERRAACEAAAAHFGVSALRDVAPEQLASAGKLDPVTLRRARHVVTENARVLDAVAALRQNDLAALGALMASSHASMRDDFAITLPPIDRLVDLLNQAIGGQGGARMTGGGFGGAVVALLQHDRIEPVIEAVNRGYRTPDGHPPQIMIERPSRGASLIF
jgi:galactokinase